MTMKQKLFVRKYLQYRGNATRAVMEIYDVKSRNAAGVIGSCLLRNAKIQREINRILEAESSILTRTVKLIESASKYGTPREQLKAAKIVFKLYSLLEGGA